MIAGKENGEPSAENNGSAPRTLPNSKKIYVNGKIYADIRVPFREISLASTKTMSGEIEINEPVRVYDTSGPWGDPNVVSMLHAAWRRCGRNGFAHAPTSKKSKDGRFSQSMMATCLTFTRNPRRGTETGHQTSLRYALCERSPANV